MWLLCLGIARVGYGGVPIRRGSPPHVGPRQVGLRLLQPPRLCFHELVVACERTLASHTRAVRRSHYICLLAHHHGGLRMLQGFARHVDIEDGFARKYSTAAHTRRAL